MNNLRQTSDLSTAVQRYFDLMYDCDTTKFDEVFVATAQLHGFRDGQMTMWRADQYKKILADRQSPKSGGAPREEEILLIDYASENQALVKVRVLINTARFIDYLIYHRIGDQWRITSKAYHLLASSPS